MEELTPEEIKTFTFNGSMAMTSMANGGDQMAKWAQSFEARGGADTYGNDALELVYLSNDFQAWLTPERKATIAKYRTDV